MTNIACLRYSYQFKLQNNVCNQGHALRSAKDVQGGACLVSDNAQLQGRTHFNALRRTSPTSGARGAASCADQQDVSSPL